MIHRVPHVARRFGVRSPARRGFSLLEVLLALAVFGAGIAGLVQCLHVSQRAGARAQFDSAALIRCKTIHGMLDAGELRADRRKPRPFEDDVRWSWTSEEKPASVPGLVERVVTVEYSASSPVGTLGGGSSARRRFSLSRLAPATTGPSWRDPPTESSRVARGRS